MAAGAHLAEPAQSASTTEKGGKVAMAAATNVQLANIFKMHAMAWVRPTSLCVQFVRRAVQTFTESIAQDWTKVSVSRVVLATLAV